MTATDRSGSEGKAQSSVGLQRLVGWNPHSNLLRRPNGGIRLKLGAARRIEKRLGRDFPHDSLLFRHGLFERRVERRTDDDGDSLRFCTALPFPSALLRPHRLGIYSDQDSIPTPLSDYCPPPNAMLSRA